MKLQLVLLSNELTSGAYSYCLIFEHKICGSRYGSHEGIIKYRLFLVVAFTRGGLGRHHQHNEPRQARRPCASALEVFAQPCAAKEVPCFLECRCPHFQLTPVRCVHNEVPDQLTKLGCGRSTSSSTDVTQSLRLACRMQRASSLSKTINIPSSPTHTGQAQQS